MRSRQILLSTYLLGFLIAIHAAIPTYVNSSFLSQFISERGVSLAYVIGSAIAIILFILVPHALHYFGNYKTLLTFILIELFVVLGLAFSGTAIPAFVLIIFHLPLVRMLFFDNDIFLENVSKDSETGGIRGTYLTLSSLGFVVSPIIVGWLLVNNEYWKVYTLSAVMLIPIAIITLLRFRSFRDPQYTHVPILNTVKRIFKHKNLYRIIMSSFILGVFYAGMVIYTPIYLLNHIGFEWGQIGILFTVMLLPFVLFEYPLGKIADKVLGEKELLSIGFVIMAIATASISFITSSSLFVWGLVLFGTRVGASFVESMSETYFFKKINSSDSDILGFFRLVRPIAYIAAPLGGSIALSFIDIRYIFVIIAAIAILGLRYSIPLKDTG